MDTEEWLVPLILLLVLAIVVVLVSYNYSGDFTGDIKDIGNQVFSSVEKAALEKDKSRYDAEAKNNLESIYNSYSKCYESKQTNCKCVLEYSEFRQLGNYGYKIVLRKAGDKNNFELLDYENKAVADTKSLSGFNGYCFADIDSGKLASDEQGRPLHFTYNEEEDVLGVGFEDTTFTNIGNPAYLYKVDPNTICVYSPYEVHGKISPFRLWGNMGLISNKLDKLENMPLCA